MERRFGSAYADSLATDHVFADLGGRTVRQALAEGQDAKRVWLVVCEEFAVPARER